MPAKLEKQGFQELQEYAISPAAIDCAVADFARQLKLATEGDEDESQRLVERKKQLDTELDRLTTAIAQGAPVSTMKNAMRERERELAEIEKKLKQTKPASVDEKIEEFRRFAIENIERVVGLCREKTQWLPDSEPWKLYQRGAPPEHCSTVALDWLRGKI
jgi:methionyl-tRNA synthetase